MAQVKGIWDILRGRYPESEFALMAEVSNAAGFYRSNSADYIAVNMWPSRGLGINGIELKSFRSDWLSELKKPKKAENIFQYCDYFWLLTTDDAIAKIEEIPATWGWQCIKGSKIKVLKDAPKLSPVPLDKHFLVGMLKRAVCKTGFVHIDSIQDKIDVAVEHALMIKKRDRDNDLYHAEENKKIIKDFEEASGIRFGNWSHDAKKIGEAVKFINNGGTDQISKDLLRLKNMSENICKNINSALSIEIETISKVEPDEPHEENTNCFDND